MRLIIRSDAMRRIKGRIIWLSVIGGMVMLVLVWRLVSLQILQHAYYLRLSESNFVKEVRVQAQRGLIFDRTGEILADDQSSYSVGVTPAFVKDPESVTLKLASYLDLDSEEVLRLNRIITTTKGLERFKEYLVGSSLDRKQLALLVSRAEELRGVTIFHGFERHYPFSDLFVHSVGYVGLPREQDLKADPTLHPGTPLGKHGVESAMDMHLRGRDGQRKIIVDSLGVEKRSPELLALLGGDRTIASEPGHDVVLTIDHRLQKTAAESFAGFESGVVLALDPRTGDLLTSYSKPGYDPNVMARGIPSSLWRRLRDDILTPLIDKGIQSAYSPASTWKALMAYAALAEHVVYPTENVYCAGTRYLGTHPFRCWNRGGHGDENVYEALMHSCDIFFYEMGSRLGIDIINRYGALFGLGEPTGVILPFERNGTLPGRQWHRNVHKRPWNLGDTYNLSIGQGDLTVTPLQLASMYGALFNGGKLWRPRLVSRVIDRDGTTLVEFSPLLRRQIDMDSDALNVVRRGLTAVVNQLGGTAYWKGRSEIATFAGKTGTAQVVSMKRGDEIKVSKPEDEFFLHQDHALFVGFWPAENPRIVVVAVAEHGQHGSSVVPVVRSVIEKYIEVEQIDSRSVERAR